MSELLSKYGYTPYQAEADEELAKTAATMPASPLNKYGITTQAQATQQRPEGMNPLARAGLGVARGIASTLEPLAMPQDVLFAIAGGALDDDTSIGDRLKTVEWAKYAPFGATPARPADGAEILGLMGVKDEQVKKWGGLVMDFTADPLIAGSALRAAGRLSKAEGLIKFGDQVDEMVSIGGAYRNIRNTPGIKDWADKRTEALLSTMRNPENKLFGFSAGEYAKGFLTSRVARNLRYGEDAGEAISDARALSDQRASDVKVRAYDMLAEAEAGLLGRDTRPFLKRGLGILSGARKAEQGVKGLPTILKDTILKEGYDLSQKRGVLTTDITNSTLPEMQALSPFASLIGEGQRAQAFTATQDAVKRIRGLAEKNKFDPDLAEKRFMDFSQRITEVDAMLGYHVSGFDFMKKRIMERVLKVGGTDDEAARTWDTLVQEGMSNRYKIWLDSPAEVAGSQLKSGGNLSAEGVAANAERRRIYKNVLDREIRAGTEPGEARRLAAEARDAAVARPVVTENAGVRDLYAQRLASLRGEGTRGAEDAFKTTQYGRQAFGAETTPLTNREVLFSGADESFSALDLESYLSGLAGGHMRRTYAMFQDTKGAENWVRSLQTGKVVMSNLLSDDMVDTALSTLPVRGVTAAGETSTGAFNVRVGGESVADLIKGYRGALEAEGRGTILTQRGIINHLTENGVSKRDAQDAYMKLVEQMNPELKPVIDNLRDVAQRYGEEGQASGGFGRAFYQERQEIDRDFLEVLGEYANPILSLAESADAAKVRISRQDFMRDVYDIATQRGLVKEGRHVDSNGANFVLNESEATWGAFAGKHMHPYLKMELERTMKPPAIRQIPLAKAFDRIRSIITGGYLASPSVITANIAGGIYSSSMAGIGPGRMMKALVDTLPPLMKGKGQSDDLKRLKEFIQVEDASMAAQGMQQNTARLKLAEAGLRSGKLNEGFDALTGFINDQLQAPLGQKWAGLEGFQFVEKWMRTAAFKAEKDHWLANIDRFEKYVPGVRDMDEADRVLAVEKFAAQKARISVMDYSELPDAVTMMRDTGLLMFPGFSYLIASRNLNAAINRPGKIAMADRFNEAIWSAAMDDEEKLAVYAGMPEWLREDGGVPVRLLKDEAGDRRWSLIPFQGLLPTNTQFGKPFAESLSTLGIYAPFFELASAFTTGTGEAVLTGRYGKEVFSPDARGVDRFTQAGEFMANTLAPGFVRKGISMGQAISRAAVPMDPALAQTIYSYQERTTGKAQRRFADEVLSSFVRAPTVITETGPLANVRKEANRLRIKRDTELRSLKKKYQEAVAMGRTDKAERLRNEIAERSEEFAELNAALAAMYQGAKR